MSMWIEERDDRLLVRAPAKLNLFLDVLGRREDGYHKLDTVIQAVDLYDELEIRPAKGGIRLDGSAPEGVPLNEENLVWKAADSVLREAGAKGGVEITLNKRIPAGGGLGGGSSDAAATLVGVDRALGLGLERGVLERLGAELGSDVPFFLYGGPARCRGRGERVEPIKRGGEFEYVIVWPEIACSTKEIYQELRMGLTRKNRGASFVVESIERADPVLLGTGIYNRFEEAVFRVLPELTAIRGSLEQFPLSGVGMSGAGSCFFGLVNPAEPVEDIAKIVRDATGHPVFRVKGVTSGAARAGERVRGANRRKDQAGRRSN